MLKNLRAILSEAVLHLPVANRKRLIMSYSLTHSPQNSVMRYGTPKGFEDREKELYADMKHCLCAYGLYFEEYLLYGLSAKSEEEKSLYVSEIGRMDLYDRYNEKGDEKLFHDKFAVYKEFSRFYHRDVIGLSDKSDLDAFCEFAHKHSEFFVKPVDKSCGFGVKKVSLSEYPDEKTMFVSLLSDGRKICEQIIEQCSFTESFNPTSLNTVRVVTLLADGRVNIVSPFFRIGRYGRNVDNAGSGGIFMSVDKKSGELKRPARDENGNFYSLHPDSRVSLSGKVLPRWNEAVELAEKLALIHPSSRLIGWDLALADKGWVLVEANFRGQFLCQQMCSGGIVL